MNPSHSPLFHHHHHHHHTQTISNLLITSSYLSYLFHPQLPTLYQALNQSSRCIFPKPPLPLWPSSFSDPAWPATNLRLLRLLKLLKPRRLPRLLSKLREHAISRAQARAPKPSPPWFPPSSPCKLSLPRPLSLLHLIPRPYTTRSQSSHPARRLVLSAFPP
jgi:hypothetical protein